MILSSLRAIVHEFSGKLPKTLALDEALYLLGKERLSHLSDVTAEGRKVLFFIAQSDRYLTQSTIAHALNKAPTNISNYYFKPLIEKGVIEVKESSGREKYWGLTRKYLPLKKLTEAQENLSKKRPTKQQLSLFERY